MGRPATLRVDIVADARGVGRGVADADDKLGKLGKAAGVAGAAVAAGLAAAGVAVGAFGLAAVGAASRAEQSAGAVESVYGAAAAQVESYAATSATQLGLAASSYRELSSVVGAQLTNMGRDQAAAAAESDQLIRIGADLAATFGGDVSTAVEAVGSLLRGERDPIEAYGVSINAAAIEARLAADGLGHLTGEQRKSAEATATLALLSEQTAGAQGAFGRETDTLAGAQAILSAKLEDTKARLGAGLTPALAAGATMLADRVLPAAERVGGELAARLGPAVTRVAGFVTGTLVPAGVEFYGWWAQKIAPYLLGAGRAAFDGLQAGIGTVTSAIDRNRPQLTSLLNGLRTVAEFVYREVVPVIGSTLGQAFTVVGGAISLAIGTVSRAVSVFRTLADVVSSAVNAVRNFRLPAAVSALFGGPPLTTSTPTLVTAGAAQLGQLATATLAGDAAVTGLLGGGRGGGVVVVDRSDRRVSITVDGALDPPAVAAQLARILDDHAVRTGRAPAFGAAA